jgi:3-hydroxyacyl-CoA dehydrogenase
MTRPDPDKVRRVACVGAGTIGGGWAAYFLARGMDVVASDPAPDAEVKLRDLVARAWPSLERLGLVAGASQSRLSFTSDLADAVSAADFIQESAPDRKDLKIDMFQKVGAATRPGVVIASSSSEFLPSEIAVNCAHPERCIIGHPFAPSYLVPLVEVVGGEQTSSQVIDWAMTFYDGIGKKALRLKQEIESYIANRLQVAVLEEMHRLVDAGICDYADVDVAMRYGPGRRWAFAGPLLCLHMGGGQKGLPGFIDHFGWTGPEGSQAKALSEIDGLYGGCGMDEIEAWRDANLLAIDERTKSEPGQ